MPSSQDETLFEAALKLANLDQRKAFLDAACANDPQMRQRIEDLLAALPVADTLFEQDAVDRGRDGASAPPLPPNRTGGFPASGSPVDGVSARESTLFAWSPSRPSVQQFPPSHRRLAVSFAAQPLRALASVLVRSFGPASFHLPAFPSLHGRYPLRRYYGRSDFVLGGSSASQRHELRDSQADLPGCCIGSSGHSVSNHLRDVRRSRSQRSADARGSFPPRQASHIARRLAHLRRPNRVHFVRRLRRTSLRTGRSRSVALHPVLPRRSYGSIPHDSSPRRNGLAPLQPHTIPGARTGDSPVPVGESPDGTGWRPLLPKEGFSDRL